MLTARRAQITLRYMLNYSPSLDVAFRALSDPTRRSILERLSRGPASVSELAEPHAMSLPSVHQHLQVLEEAGLMVSEKKGRVRRCRVEPQGLRAVESWVLSRRALWDRRLDALSAHLENGNGKQGGKT